MERRPLGNTGLRVSALAFGASPLGGVFGPMNQDDADSAVHAALDAGVDYFDVAPYYGLTRAESVLGQSLVGVPREKYVISTKVGRYDRDEFDFSPARVTRSVDESLARLRCGHIDLIICHDIEFGDIGRVIHETIPALEALCRTGKVRHVGVSGLPLRIFREVNRYAKLDAIISYCRYTLFDDALAVLIPEFKVRHVGVINAAPLGMGLLTRGGPPAWHPAPQALKQACAQAAQWCSSHGIDIAHLALRYAIENPDIASTIVGIASATHLRQNVKHIETPIDPEALREVKAILKPVKNYTWHSGRLENN